MCDAVMGIPPFSAGFPDAEVLEYFRQIARAVEIPVIVQDASSYVGQAIDLSGYTQLIDEFGAERIYFKPETSPLGPDFSRLRDATQGQARVFEGSGGISLMDNYQRGIRGTMPRIEFLEGVVLSSGEICQPPTRSIFPFAHWWPCNCRRALMVSWRLRNMCSTREACLRLIVVGARSAGTWMTKRVLRWIACSLYWKLLFGMSHHKLRYDSGHLLLTGYVPVKVGWRFPGGRGSVSGTLPSREIPVTGEYSGPRPR